MSIWGKIVGGAAGFAIGGPLGALIGAAAGHAVDMIRDAGPGEPADATRSITFTIGVIVLGAKMAKVDGRVSRDEIAAFRQVFHVPPEETENVARVFNQARRDHRGFEPYARQIADMLGDRPAVLEELVHCLLHIARADGTLNAPEKEYLRAVATIFGLDGRAFERLMLAETGGEETDPWALLGLAPGAAQEEIRAAWLKLTRENHPDRLIAAGMPPEFVEVATAKMAAINAAYDRLRRQAA
jgi:DnaJ like chaperone protein